MRSCWGTVRKNGLYRSVVVGPDSSPFVVIEPVATGRQKNPDIVKRGKYALSRVFFFYHGRVHV